MDDRFSVSLFQFHIVDRDLSANIGRFRDMAAKLEQIPDVIVLPEFWTGISDVSGGDGSEAALAAVCEICRDLGTYVLAGSLPWATERGTVCRSWIVDDAGSPVAFYDRIHLASHEGERAIFMPGEAPLLFRIGEVPCSVLSGYDVRFPEFARSLSLGGAKIIFVPARWSAGDEDAWRFLLQAMAANNQVYVVACNAVGESPGQLFAGASMVVSPRGDILGSDDAGTGVLTFSFALHEIEKSRAYLPLEGDRKPQFYCIASL